ncbi:MAG: glycosyltransferase, partial [bacterium]
QLMKTGADRIPFLIVESDMLERARLMCGIFERESGENHFGQIVRSKDNLWLTISRSRRDFYLGQGIPADNIYPFPMSRSSIGFSFPEAVGNIERQLPESEWGESVRAIRGNVLAVGTNERDYETLAEAARGLDVETHVICDLRSRRQAKREGLFWHDSMPMAQFVEAIRQSLFVAIPLKPVEKNFGQMGAALPMALGKAVVATETESLKEHVISGATGELVPPTDPAALRVALEKMIGSPELRKKYGIAASALEKELSAIARKSIADALGRIRSFHGM